MKVTVERKLGQHLTSVDIFKTFILPQIRMILHRYLWVDIFCGEGNLILPILDEIAEHQRIQFFNEHIYMYDKDPKMVEKCIENALKYGIPLEMAKSHIKVRDTLLNPPIFDNLPYPLYHITNPPYLYIGSIQKTPEFHENLKYFEGINEGYQDLYQIALINDLRNNVKNMIYVLPTNFIYGNAVSNKIRNDFLPKYKINKSYIFEKKSFEHTGTNVGVFSFEKRDIDFIGVINFFATKINTTETVVEYKLDPKNNYRTGNSFNEFITRYKQKQPLKLKFHLTTDMVNKHKGSKEVKVIDSNDYKKRNGYSHVSVFVNKDFSNTIKNNILWIRTIDNGNMEGRAGLYHINVFGEEINGILAKKEYRTNPIQVFFMDKIPIEEQRYVKEYFNIVLEHLRIIDGSDFMTTYKYSNCSYIRKYLGLYQVKNILTTYPAFIPVDVKAKLILAIDEKNIEKIISVLEISRNFNVE